MTHEKYLEALSRAGFTYALMWSAAESRGPETVWSYAIYAPDSHLLTSVILRSYRSGENPDTFEIAAYFCSEGNDVIDDISDLKGLWSRQIARRNRERRNRESRRRTVIA